jgi:hypothetical protein
MAGFANLLAYFARLGGRTISQNLLRDLEPNSQILDLIRTKFSQNWRDRERMVVWSFGEALPLPLIGLQVKLKYGAVFGHD